MVKPLFTEKQKIANVEDTINQAIQKGRELEREEQDRLRKLESVLEVGNAMSNHITSLLQKDLDGLKEASSNSKAYGEGISEGRRQLAFELLKIINAHGSGNIVKQLVYDEIKQKLQEELK